jgi:hypothetical protein
MDFGTHPVYCVFCTRLHAFACSGLGVIGLIVKVELLVFQVLLDLLVVLIYCLGFRIQIYFFVGADHQKQKNKKLKGLIVAFRSSLRTRD